MFNSDKKVLCTAGISHVLLYPNGDVYRCMADYNAKRPPLFNAKDGWKKIETILECTHDRCYAGCDIDWATKWVFEPKKRAPQKIKAQCYHVNLSDGKYWAEQTFERPLKNMIHIVWAPTLICNYDCRYCGCAVGFRNIHKDFPSAFPELSVEEWINVWDEIIQNYDFGILTMGGGEPLLSKATLPVIKRISHKFAASITTNLSVNVFELVRERPTIKYSRTALRSVVASLHLTAKGFNREMFLSSVLYLKNNGIAVTVNFVGHPMQLFLAEEYKAWCKKYDIPFVLSPWCGCDNDGYEAKYTPVELAFVNKIAPASRKTSTQVSFYALGHLFILDQQIQTLPLGVAEVYVLRGKLKNTSNCSWNNQGLDHKESFKVGGRLFHLGEEEKPVREFRAVLPEKEIKPQEECSFELKIETEGLSCGKYILRLDVVKENSFWFKDKGATPLDIMVDIGLQAFPSQLKVLSEFLEAKVPKKIRHGALITVPVKVKNCGSAEWFSTEWLEDIQVGCRIFKENYKWGDVALRDLRTYPSKVIKPGEILETEIVLDFRGIPKGVYTLVFDMVNEKKYWFVERGSSPLVTKVTLI
ncbi:MAG: hypothetical protein NC923_04445 [Candidatus Omnitrophica bacterium]|nr:hypothetical protein [Candidatus Omnitrophota bacterium]